MTEPDEAFANPRLAAVYDALDPDRSDVEVYASIAEEFEMNSVLDVGCGTGVFAVLLAGRGVKVVGVDPAAASLAVARGKPGADAVRWVHGTAPDVLPLQVDGAFMTANVAQVFVSDDTWRVTLDACFDALRPGGHLVFETRVLQRRAWTEWTKEQSHSVKQVDGEGLIESWHHVTQVHERDDRVVVTFEAENHFLRDGACVPSSSTLVFRSRELVESTLAAAGFELVEVRDAPDRPGREWVFIARKPDLRYPT